ncbi:MAG: histidine decarboxylase, pyruvoyl type, partial [Actinomycetota bacterium]|nr:histidine decarboxylase, pyruvoyl type [Actinomycetota bacterium]
ATSVLRIGEIQRYEIEEVLVGLRKISLNKGEIGCALVAAPYISLARKAIPRNGFSELRRMSLSEWAQFAFQGEGVAFNDNKSLLESFVAP